MLDDRYTAGKACRNKVIKLASLSLPSAEAAVSTDCTAVQSDNYNSMKMFVFVPEIQQLTPGTVGAMLHLTALSARCFLQAQPAS